MEGLKSKLNRTEIEDTVSKIEATINDWTNEDDEQEDSDSSV